MGLLSDQRVFSLEGPRSAQGHQPQFRKTLKPMPSLPPGSPAHQPPAAPAPCGCPQPQPPRFYRLNPYADMPKICNQGLPKATSEPIRVTNNDAISAVLSSLTEILRYQEKAAT